jgi:uncharacterized protein with FMN-binding domain
MAKKMPRRLVAVSSSAIAAIYLAGFAYTRGADAGLAPSATSVPTTVTTTSAAQPTVVVSTSAAPSATTPATASSSPTPAPSTASSSATQSSSPTTSTVSPSTSTSPATATAAAASAYRDGTYTGTGTSRRGDVTVSVTVLAGRITNVTITSVNTQYPVSRISSLPAQVISRQSSQVDNVSGATYSAQAFRLAVQAALGKAGA